MEVSNVGMDVDPILLTSHQVRIAASHALREPSLTVDQNAAIYGSYALPHNHEWVITVVFRGPHCRLTYVRPPCRSAHSR